MPILDSTKRFLATSTCTKIQEVVLFNFGLLLGASTNLQPPGFQKILISFGKMGENWIFQIETVNCWKKWRLAGNCCNEGFLRQIPPGCFKTLHKFFYGDSRELTPNHPTVTIHQKPTIPKCISLFTPSKKTRKQLLQSAWKKNMNNKNPSQKKKNIELSIQFLVFLLSSKTASKQYTWPDLGGRETETSSSRGEKKPWGETFTCDLWVWLTLIFIHVTCWYTCTGCTCIYMIVEKNDKHKSHKSILQSSTTTVNH